MGMNGDRHQGRDILQDAVGRGEAYGVEEEVPHNRDHLVQMPVTCAMTQAPGLETAWRDSPYQVGGEVDI